MYDFNLLRGRFSLSAFFKHRKYLSNFRRLYPDYFYPDGLILFCGSQGSGKTLSAVRYVEQLAIKYPKSIIVSNISLNLDCSNSIVPYRGLVDLSSMDNGYKGIICLIDEIQTEFNSLQSKNISPSIIAMISQQRKRRCHIVGTTQLFGRVAKPFREQCNAAIDCNAGFFDTLQYNHIIDLSSCSDVNGELSEYQYSGHTHFMRSAALFDKYDTYQRISYVGYDAKS